MAVDLRKAFPNDCVAYVFDYLGENDNTGKRANLSEITKAVNVKSDVTYDEPTVLRSLHLLVQNGLAIGDDSEAVISPHGQGAYRNAFNMKKWIEDAKK